MDVPNLNTKYMLKSVLVENHRSQFKKKKPKVAFDNNKSELFPI